MWYGLFSRKVKPAKRSRRARAQRFAHRLLLEPLEDRSLLSVGLISLPIVKLAAGTVASSIHSKVNPPAARAATTTSLGLSAAASTYSVPITATVTVSSTTAGTPTGFVAIAVNGWVVDFVSVATAAAGVSLTPSAGTDKITASYSGDKTFASSISSAQTETVAQASTTISLASSTTGPTTYGDSIVFTATVSPVLPAVWFVNGQVEFFDNGSTTPFATQQVSGTQGVAIFSWDDLAVGAHSITAEFVANNNYASSGLSNAVSQTVNAAATKTVLVSSQNRVPSNTAVTFTADVSSNVTASPIWTGGGGWYFWQPPLAQPTGSVTFTAVGTTNTTPITETVKLSDGQATWTPSPNLADDTYTVTATYVPNGGSNYTGSDSTASPLTEVVGGLASQITLVASANPVKSGTVVTFTVTVAPASGSGAVPTGTVTVVAQGVSQTFTLDGTTDTFTFSLTMSSPPELALADLFRPITPQPDLIIATYSGDTNYSGSSTQLVEWIGPVFPKPAGPAVAPAVSQPILGGGGLVR